MKTIILTAVAAAAIAMSAQAQTQYLTPGMAYTFTGTAASGGGTISYQWYRDGEPIAGAADISYTLPDNLAYGKNVEFKRGAVSSVCPHNTSYTDIAVITFCDLIIDGICWASTNVATVNKFAPRPDMYTQFYQWNRLTAWAATGDISGWDTIPNQSTTWTVNPCPEGWRVPTLEEFTALINSGSTWASIKMGRGNVVSGRFYGPNSDTCSPPNNMVGCIFLPLLGYRQEEGMLWQTSNSEGEFGQGHYWSGSQNYHSTGNRLGYSLAFGGSTNNPTATFDKSCGMPIRCVQ